jgi:hypothetical protein
MLPSDLRISENACIELSSAGINSNHLHIVLAGPVDLPLIHREHASLFSDRNAVQDHGAAVRSQRVSRELLQVAVLSLKRFEADCRELRRDELCRSVDSLRERPPAKHVIGAQCAHDSFDISSRDHIFRCAIGGAGDE